MAGALQFDAPECINPEVPVTCSYSFRKCGLSLIALLYRLLYDIH